MLSAIGITYAGLGLYLGLLQALALLPPSLDGLARGGTLALGLASIPAFLVVFVGGVISSVVVAVAWVRGRPAGRLHLFLACALFALLSFALVARYLPLPQYLPRGSNRIRFDAAIWRLGPHAERTDGITHRQAMLRDVVSNVLPGKRRDKVLRLLGPPPDYDPCGRGGGDLLYDLGSERDHPFGGIDDEWLLIQFDRRGRFRRFEIRRD